MFGKNSEAKNTKKQQHLEEILAKASGLVKHPDESFEQYEARVKAKETEFVENQQIRINQAKQMYQYCVDNKYGQGMNENWGIKHFALIQESLQSDEEVIMCFIGLHNYVSATKHDNNFAYAITNKRIIMAQQKVIGQVIQSVAINNLNDVTMTTGMLFGVITIDTIKETFNIAVDSKSAKSINEKIHEVLFSLKEKKNAVVQTQVISSADEILKFKNLLDIGVITQEEFDKKKKELLDI